MILAPTPYREAMRDRLILVMLAVVALVSVMIAASELYRLFDDQNDAEVELREDVTWLIVEIDRDLRGLHAQAELISSGAEAGYHEELLRQLHALSLDIGQLNRGAFALDIGSNEQLSNWARSLNIMIADLTPRMVALIPGAPEYREKVGVIAAGTEAWIVLSSRLLARANAGTEALRASDAAYRQKVGDRLVVMALLLLLAFLGICGLLFIHLRNLGRANRHLMLLQERSRRNVTRARSASAAKSAFLAAMSHEIRTPLNAIIGSAELLALRRLPDGTDRQLGTITAQAFLLRDLIDGVLDFSRLEAGVFDTRRTDTNLAALADLLSQAFADEARIAGLHFGVDLPAARVMVDDARLRQILVNLIGNALKFTPKGRVDVRGTLSRPDLLRVEVQDDGIGIPEEALPLLFREFSQIDASNSRCRGGSGLGLAICHRVVTGLGGRIGVTSTAGAGSMFWFELPVTPVPDTTSDSAPDTLSGKQALPALPGTGHALRILVAEDNEINLEVIDGLLRHLGHTVHIARNGCQAVAAADMLCPDLVLMDMQMPGMDGLRAARLIRAARPDLPIIAVTANAFAEDRRACLDAGMSDFLPKPLTRETLAAAISLHCPTPRDRAFHDGQDGAFADLVAEFGPATVRDLLDRFDAGITGLRSGLLGDDGAGPEMMAQDAALHSFAGAALTLGLGRTGTAAKALRRRLPAGPDEIAALVAIAQSDVATAQDIVRDFRI